MLAIARIASVSAACLHTSRCLGELEILYQLFGEGFLETGERRPPLFRLPATTTHAISDGS